MEPKAAITASEYVLWLLFRCLCLTPTSIANPVFALVLSNESVVETFLLDSSLEFAPGLLECLQSGSPPTVAWFKSLPGNCGKRWAVYCLLLEKPGEEPKIYIGSGTDKKDGLQIRFHQYDNGKCLPRFIEQALKEGYTIVHKGCLCSAPIPLAPPRFQYRILVIALECTFTWAFWAMRSRKWLGMHSLCRWPVASLEYGGCCSHSALSERVVGDTSSLTPEQIDAAEKTRLELSRAYQAKYYLEKKKENPDGWLAARRASAKKYQNKVKDSGVIKCEACNTTFQSRKDKRRHEATAKHIANTTTATKIMALTSTQVRHNANVLSRRYYCSTCHHAFVTQQKLDQHMNGKNHARKLARSRPVSASSSPFPTEIHESSQKHKNKKRAAEAAGSSLGSNLA